LLRPERRSRAVSENGGGQIWNIHSHHRHRTPERRKIPARVLATNSPELVLTCGFAGALNPDLKPGEVVLN